MDIPKSWDEIEEQVYQALNKIVTVRFSGHLDRGDIIHGAYLRMQPAYQSALRRGAIKELKGWIYVKGRTCARDERKDLLGLRRETSEVSIHAPEPGSDDPTPLIETDRVNKPADPVHHYTFDEIFKFEFLRRL